MAWRGSAGGTSVTTGDTVVITVNGIGGVGPQNGDLVILQALVGSGQTISCPGFSSVSGLTAITETDSGQTYAVPLWKIAGPSEPSSYTISSSANNGAMAADCNVFIGRNPTSPFTAVSQVAPTAGPFPISIPIPGVTAAAGDDLLFLAADGSNKGSNTSALSVPSGFGNVLDTNATATAAYTTVHSCNQTNVAGGATGTVTGTITSASGANTNPGGFLLSLAQASSSHDYSASGARVTAKTTGTPSYGVSGNQVSNAGLSKDIS
jgi:hypothetical protein